MARKIFWGFVCLFLGFVLLVFMVAILAPKDSSGSSTLPTETENQRAQQPPSATAAVNSGVAKPSEQSGDDWPQGMPSDNQPATLTVKAISESPDVQSSPLSSGGMSVSNPFGLCGILYERQSDYLWSASRPVSFPSFDIGMATAIRECEASYRSRVQPSPQSPIDPASASKSGSSQ